MISCEKKKDIRINVFVYKYYFFWLFHIINDFKTTLYFKVVRILGELEIIIYFLYLLHITVCPHPINFKVFVRMRCMGRLRLWFALSICHALRCKNVFVLHCTRCLLMDGLYHKKRVGNCTTHVKLCFDDVEHYELKRDVQLLSKTLGVFVHFIVILCMDARTITK